MIGFRQETAKPHEGPVTPRATKTQSTGTRDRKTPLRSPINTNTVQCTATQCAAFTPSLFVLDCVVLFVGFFVDCCLLYHYVIVCYVVVVVVVLLFCYCLVDCCSDSVILSHTSSNICFHPLISVTICSLISPICLDVFTMFL